jgi:hypothetical protein
MHKKKNDVTYFQTQVLLDHYRCRICCFLYLNVGWTIKGYGQIDRGESLVPDGWAGLALRCIRKSHRSETIAICATL